MQKLVWQNSNGDEIDLTSGSYGITEWEGFANTSLNIQSQQVPFQDGGVFLDALLEQRDLSVTLKMNDGGNLENRYRMRRELIHILNPKLGEGYLIYTNDFTSKRIKCVAQVPLFETHNANDSGTPSASLAWTACEPYWEDVEETEIFLANNESVSVELDTDKETQIEAVISGDIDDDSELIINDKKIALTEFIQKGLQLNTNIGKKSIHSIEWINEINYATGIYSIQYCDGYFWFCGGIFENTNGSSTTLFKSKDLKKFEVEMNMEITTASEFSCLSMSEELNYGFLGCDFHCYKYENHIWSFIEDSNTYRGAISLDSRKEVLAIQNDKLCRTTDFSNWTVIDESKTYSLLKKIKETINGVFYIGMVYTNDGIYGITDDYTLIRFGSSSHNQLICTNGYFYYFESNTTLKRTRDFVNNETCKLVESDNLNSYLQDIVFSDKLNLYVGVSETSKIFTSDDGVVFYERNYLNSETPTIYTRNNIFIKDYNILVSGSLIGLYEYFKQKFLLFRELGYYKYLENEIGNLKISATSASFNNGDWYTLPLTPLAVACSPKIFVIMDSDGNIYRSENGTDWIFCTRLVSSSGFNWDVKDICYSEEFKEWAVTSDIRELFRSKDLITWEYKSGGSGNLSITAGKGCYVISTSWGDVKKILPNGTTQYLGISFGVRLEKIIHIPELKCYMVTDRTHLYMYPDFASDWSNWQLVATFTVNSVSDFFFNKKLNAIFVISDFKIYYSYKGSDWNVYTKVFNYGFRRIFNSKKGVLLVSNANNVIDGIITVVEQDNIIDKLSVDSDMNLSLEENNIISFLNSNPSSVKITYRQKYIGV